MGRVDMRSFRVLTPPGLASVAVIRLRGDVDDLPLTDFRGRPMAPPPLDGVVVAQLRPGGELLDDAVVVGTDDGVELQVHGGSGVQDGMVQFLLRRGWSREVAAPSTAPCCLRHVRASLSCSGGPLAALAMEARDALRAGFVPAGLRTRLRGCLARANFASRLACAARVRIVGQPNAGKSTLFNAMLGSERSLVSPEPGTTCDTVAARLLIRGVPVVLEDTAGTFDADPSVAGADLVVHVLSAEHELALPADLGVAVLEVCGMADLRPHSGRALAVSGRTGTGIAQLMEAIADRLDLSDLPGDDVLAPVDVGLRVLVARALAIEVSSP